MDAAGTSNWRSSTRAFEPARLLRAAVALGMLLLALAGVMLAARRMAGALIAPPSAAWLALVGLLLAAAGLGFRRVFLEGTQPARVRWAIAAIPIAVNVLWLAALSLPQTSGWGLLLLCGPVLLAEGWSWGRLGRPVADEMRAPIVLAPLPATAKASPQNVSPPIPTEVAPLAVAPLTVAKVTGTEFTATPPAVNPLAANAPVAEAADEQSAEAFSDACDEELAEAAERDANALQQQSRRRDDEAGEVVDGWVRVDFAAGQRHAAAHIAICPPMHGKPTCYAEPGDGPDASVKITQAMSYGVRLEVKLDEVAEEPASVVVEYSILEHAAAEE